MEENKVSRTAMWTAYIHAYHVRHDAPPRIVDDFLAYQMIPDEIRASIEQGAPKFLQLLAPERAAACSDQATAVALLMRAMVGPANILCRARYTEDSLAETVRQGVRQYVILGAGMDTFVFRQPEMLEQLQVFEVDHPATQAFKRERLAALGWKQPAQLHFVPLDFTKECLATALRSSGYDPRIRTFFSWLGVTYYLPREAVFATLRTIADIAPAGSTVIFDYQHTDVFKPEKTSKNMQMGMEYLRQVGEPIITGFDPTSLTGDLAHLGLRMHEDLSPVDIEGRYFQGRTDGYHATEHGHFAWAVVK